MAVRVTFTALATPGAARELLFTHITARYHQSQAYILRAIFRLWLGRCPSMRGEDSAGRSWGELIDFGFRVEFHRWARLPPPPVAPHALQSREPWAPSLRTIEEEAED